ncbi:hypothetical protein NC652_016997 [Populus alba x Populus x berolinensis]|nr:hypothetical protein NC652_016997 [Populus alba x Populus x berolinensis]
MYKYQNKQNSTRKGSQLHPSCQDIITASHPQLQTRLSSYLLLYISSLLFSHLDKLTKQMAAREPFNVTERAPKTGAVTPHSPWHSPVPYLFGGLAAMLGLIAFALLILACSYWKLSGYLESGNEGGERDLEAGEGENKSGDGSEKKPIAFEEKILVIMAGEVKPTFLATPMSSRSTSFGDTSSEKSCSCSSEKSEKLGNVNDVEMVKQGNTDEDHQVQSGDMDSHESSSQNN